MAVEGRKLGGAERYCTRPAGGQVVAWCHVTQS
jgi:hypothetical protein